MCVGGCVGVCVCVCVRERERERETETEKEALGKEWAIKEKKQEAIKISSLANLFSILINKNHLCKTPSKISAGSDTRQS